MNIFFLSTDPREAARMLCDKHVVKMILEMCQMLWTAYHLSGDTLPSHIKVYKVTHRMHPMCVWVRSSRANFLWTVRHAIAIGMEYTRRFGKRHACQDMAEWFIFNIPSNFSSEQVAAAAVSPRGEPKGGDPKVFATDEIPNGCTPVPLTITNKELIVGLQGKVYLVQSYRNYYLVEKRRFAVWKYTPTPHWWSTSVKSLDLP